MDKQASDTVQQSKLLVEPSNTNFADWLNQPYISASLREQLTRVDVLFVPKAKYPNESMPLFPEGTEAMFRYMQDHVPDEMCVGICIEDEDYRELALHFAIYDLGAIIATLIAAPVVAQLIANYIQKNIDKKQGEHVKFELAVVDQEGRSARIFYEGPANQFESKVIPAVKNLKLNATQQVLRQPIAAPVITDESDRD